MMSFNDRAPRRGSAVPRRGSTGASGNPESSQGGAGGLSGELQEYQKLGLVMKEKVSDLRRIRTGISKVQHEELNSQIQDLQKMEMRLRNQLETQMKGLDQLPRTEIAQKRITLSKLSKDFERVRQLVVLAITESQSLKIDKFSESEDSKTGSGNPKPSTDGDKGSIFRADKRGAGGQVQFQSQIHGQAVDDLIAEERERDIKKMNQDLRLVNEMFRDMAEIVDKQNPHIEKVAESAKASHERAEAGLEQVQQAAAHQGGCIMA